MSEEIKVASRGPKSFISHERQENFPPIFPEIEDWPINKLTEDRPAFVAEVEKLTFGNLIRKSDKFLHDVVEKTIYQEQTRMKEEPWTIDPPNDNLFLEEDKKAAEQFPDKWDGRCEQFSRAY